MEALFQPKFQHLMMMVASFFPQALRLVSIPVLVISNVLLEFIVLIVSTVLFLEYGRRFVKLLKQNHNASSTRERATNRVIDYFLLGKFGGKPQH